MASKAKKQESSKPSPSLPQRDDGVRYVVCRSADDLALRGGAHLPLREANQLARSVSYRTYLERV